jgi:hypothetical protein
MTSSEYNDFVNKLDIYDYAKYFNSLWLYKANYGDSWWSYDVKSSLKLEQLYRNRLYGSLNDAEIATIKKMNEEYIDKMFYSNSKSISTTLSSTTSNNEIVGFIFDDIDFDDSNDSDYTKYSNITSDNKEHSYLTQMNEYMNSTPIDDIIDINGIYYRIDLDKLIQINTLFPNKRRLLKRLTVNKTDLENTKTFIEKYKIKGIAGIAFT